LVFVARIDTNQSNVLKLNKAKITLSETVTDSFGSIEVINQLGTLYVTPQLTSTILFQKGSAGIPDLNSIGSFDQILSVQLGKKSDGKYNTVKNALMDVSPIINNFVATSDYNATESSCRNIDDAAKKLGFNIYDRAGMLYKLISEYKVPLNNQDPIAWSELHRQILSDNGGGNISSFDLKYYKTKSFDKCLSQKYYTALKKMGASVVNQEKFDSLIKSVTTIENLAKLASVKKTANQFQSIVRRKENMSKSQISAQFSSITESLKVPNKPDLVILVADTFFGEDILEKATKLAAGSFNRYGSYLTNDQIASLIKDVNLTNIDCQNVSYDDGQKPNGANYLFSYIDNSVEKYGALKIRMNNTGRNIVEITFVTPETDEILSSVKSTEATNSLICNGLAQKIPSI
jgi:hypothetical protein